MATLGLAVVTIVLGGLAVRCAKVSNKVTLGAFWAAYATTALLFAGIV